MPAISAVDAISPAIQRTRTFLFRPFKWGTFLKLCLVALITEGFGGNFNFSAPGSHPSNHGHNFSPPFTFTPGLVAAFTAAALAFVVLCFVLYYLVTRLRFAYFHCLIHNIKQIRPGWHLHRSQATRFFWLNVVVGFCFMLLAAIIALPFIAGFWRLFHQTPVGSHPHLGLFLSLLLPLIPIFLLFILAAIVADLILRDLILPHFALDNATAGQAWTAVWARIRAEKGPFFVYALLRVLLPIAAAIALFVVLIIPALIVAAVFAVIVIGIHSALADATGATAVAGIVLEVLMGVIAFGLLLLAGICLEGPLGTAVRQYALLFYGARYPRLGEILFPPPDVSLNPPVTP